MSQDLVATFGAAPKTLSAPDDTDLLIQSLLAASSPFTGTKFLDNVVESLGNLFDADTTFLARRLRPDGPMVRVLAAWKDGQHKESWDYDLTGNPCQLPYEGNPTLIPCDVKLRFEKKRDSNYESFVGLPLRDENDNIFGHIAIYNSQRLADAPKWLEIAALFAGRAESEIHRLFLEREKEKTIAALETANAELDEVNRLKSLFLGTAAHDLRNPLSIISAYAKLISSEAIAEKDVVGMADRIGAATERMVSLIDSYLDVASIEGGAIKLDKKPVPLEACIRERLDFLQSLARVKNIEILSQLAPVPILSLDELRIEQVVDNLMGNAIKFSPPGKDILIELDEEPGSVWLSVSDQGPGIPDDAMADLFLPFVTGGTKATGDEKNTGLGMAIVQRIVKAHGGSITAENLPGSGAKFTVQLPV